jgi:hypothetical protein
MELPDTQKKLGEWSLLILLKEKIEQYFPYSF